MIEDLDHHCGVGAIVDPRRQQSVAPFVGPLLRRIVHRGAGGCGAGYINEYSGELEVIHREGDARSVMQHLQAKTYSAIVHTLYRTNPHSMPHPYLATFRDQQVAVAFNGNIPAHDRERNAQKYLKDHGNESNTRSDTELIGRLIAMHLHDTQGNMKKAFQRLPDHLGDGAYNIVALRPQGQVDTLRDPHGIHPLVMGTTKDGFHAIASEDQALRTVWSKARHIDVSRIKPGMMVRMGPGILQPEMDQLFASDPKYCSFELAYFADFMATLDGARVLSVRRKFGQRLAALDTENLQEWRNPTVVPVPDSARIAAEGYADEAHIRHIDVLLKRPDAVRTFIQPSEREARIKEKFLIDWSLLFGRDVVLVDDSLVRGTTMKTVLEVLHNPDSYFLKIKHFLTENLPMLKKYGIRIHLRFAFPPIIAPCFYGIDFSKRSELLVPQFSPFAKPQGDTLSPDVLQKIAKYLGADSVQFLPISAVHEAAGIPENQMCRACFTGEYPTKAGQELYDLQLSPALQKRKIEEDVC